MVVLVVVVVLAVLVVAVAVYRRVFGSDSRSIAGHHTVMERLEHLHPTDGRGRDRDPYAGVRVLERVAPQAAVTDDTLRNPSDRWADEPAAATASVEPVAVTGPGGHRATAVSGHGSWGPPVQPLSWGPPAPPAEGASPSAARGGTDSRLLFFGDETPDRPVDAPSPSPALARRKHPLSRTLALCVISIAVIAAVVVAVVAFASGGTSPHHASSPASRLGGQPTSSGHESLTAPASHPLSAAPSKPPTTRRASPTTAAAPTAPPGNRPAIRAISPTSGVAGQQVMLTGWNLFSSNGLIIVRFGSVQTGVACPVQTTCRVTVPTLPFSHPTPVAVTLTTDTATTNAVVFTYR